MGSKRKLVNRSEHDDSNGSGEEETQLELEKSIKELCRKDDPQLGQGGHRELTDSKKAELISKLEVARQEEADLERMARRIVWRREVRRTMKINAEFKEIMEKVPLKEVEEDKKPRMSRLSLEWREAFKKDRASFLFPEAIKSAEILKRKLRKRLQLVDDRDLVLKLRLVSKSLKEAIDDPAVLTKNFLRSVHINGLKEATDLTKMLGQDMNPFVFRSVGISWSIDESRHEFWKEMKVILARWGKEIRSTTITFNALPEDTAITNEYDMLVAYLKLMPNLRSLVIFVSSEYTDLNKLRDRIVSNPLPELPYLRFVRTTMRTFTGWNTTIWPNIIRTTQALLSRYNRSLESMELAGMAFPLEGHFPSLRKLKLLFWSPTGMEELVNMNIFTGLNNWGTQLKELTLEVIGKALPRHMLSRSYASKGLFLELPHLETLSLSMCYLPLETLDILLPCKSLKTIIYSAYQYRDDLDPWAAQDDEGIFQFPNRLNLYESNIWVLLPELKRIKMDIKTYKLSDRDKPSSVFYDRIKTGQYTRVGYQKHCKLQRVQSEMREEPK